LNSSGLYSTNGSGTYTGFLFSIIFVLPYLLLEYTKIFRKNQPQKD
jgi:tetrahydromethanopterin S-methyltransferase subunit F